MRTRIPAFALCFFIAACTAPAPEPPPAGWQRIDAPGFRFHVPPDMKPLSVQGTDSLVGAYQGDSISLSFDYGRNSDPVADEGRPNYSARRETIDGKRVRIVSFDNPGSGHRFDYAIAVNFPRVNDAGDQLTIFATCDSEADYPTVRRIFRTVEFR